MVGLVWPICPTTLGQELSPKCSISLMCLTGWLREKHCMRKFAYPGPVFTLVGETLNATLTAATHVADLEAAGLIHMLEEHGRTGKYVQYEEAMQKGSTYLYMIEISCG